VKPDPKLKNLESYLVSLPKGGVAAELGVWRGLYARMSYDALKPSKMYLVDWWMNYSNSSTVPEMWQKVKGQALGKFKSEIESKKVKVIAEDFVTAAIQIPSNHIDFIRHDGDEREPQVSATLRAWWRTLKKDGIWLGHGFLNEPRHGTIPAVVKFLKSNLEAELLGLLADGSHFILRKNT